jgi:hypothetical protein
VERTVYVLFSDFSNLARGLGRPGEVEAFGFGQEVAALHEDVKSLVEFFNERVIGGAQLLSGADTFQEIDPGGAINSRDGGGVAIGVIFAGPPGDHPGVEIFAAGQDCAFVSYTKRTTHGKAKSLFPPLYGTYALAHVASDIFPTGEHGSFVFGMGR